MSEKDLISSDINAYISNQAVKDTMRFITCGSVDDGKSTHSLEGSYMNQR